MLTFAQATKIAILHATFKTAENYLRNRIKPSKGEILYFQDIRNDLSYQGIKISNKDLSKVLNLLQLKGKYFNNLKYDHDVQEFDMIERLQNS